MRVLWSSHSAKHACTAFCVSRCQNRQPQQAVFHAHGLIVIPSGPSISTSPRAFKVLLLLRPRYLQLLEHYLQLYEAEARAQIEGIWASIRIKRTMLHPRSSGALHTAVLDSELGKMVP